MTSDHSNDGRRDRWIFLGSGLLVITAVLVGLAREQHWGQPMVHLRLSGPTASGLKAGQEVRISGLPVGQVQSLELQPDASVAVRLQVASRYASLIGPRSVASQGQEGFVGDRFLEISADPQPGRPATDLNNRVIRYEPPVAIEVLMEQLVTTQQELQATLRNTHKLTGSDLPQTLQEARLSLNGINNLARTLQRESVSTGPDLRQTLRQITRTGSSAEQTSAQAHQLLQVSQPLLIRTLEDLQQMSRSSRGLLENLLGTPGMNEGRPAQPKP
jgi:ABC-type transporter Mla subunit MlaD